MSDPTARAVATVGVWLATSVILTFGVFRSSWSGDIATFAMLVFLVAAICAAAATSTAAIWGWGLSKSGELTPLSDRPSGVAK